MYFSIFRKHESQKLYKNRLWCGRNRTIQNSRCYATSVTLQREAGCTPGKIRQAQTNGTYVAETLKGTLRGTSMFISSTSRLGS